ncbi:MAG: hypothetical protein H0X64_05535 [Gemmatimonadaceae bacterium]|nr:hypothetical protein [Gemmatimonadaceae bacterium]
MRLPVQVEPAGGVPPDVDYRWDADTDILSARVRFAGDLPAAIALAVAGPADLPVTDVPPTMSAEVPLSGAVELEGRDGSWIVLDVEAGHLAGIEVAVWPNVRTLTGLTPPADVEDARIRVAGRKRRGPRGWSATAHEVTTHLTAETDPSERTIHFRLGRPREFRSVRFGRDLLVDIDAQGDLAGLWLLNVPPVPKLT